MRSTRQRAQVLGALAGGEALAAQELHRRLRDSGSNVGLATVYRTLNLLAEEGVVDVLRDEAEARYRRCTLEHHHHLTCSACGKVEEISDCRVEAWAKKVAAAHGFEIRAHHAEIVGVCARCARRRPREASR